MTLRLGHLLVIAAVIVAAVLLWKHRARITSAFKG